MLINRIHPIVQPLQLTDQEINSLCHFSKIQYLKTVQEQLGAWNSKCELNPYPETLLWLMKLAGHDFEELSTLFALRDHKAASRIFYRHLIFQFKNNINLKNIVGIDGQINQSEVDKLYQEAYDRTPEFDRKLLEKFRDPAGQSRIPVGINTDATYIDVCHSQDVELQKSLYCSHRSKHTVKVLNFTDLSGKIVAILPLASSQSPSSGNILKMY